MAIPPIEALRRSRGRPRPNRKRRLLVSLAVFVVLIAIVGFFVLPPIVRGQIEKRGSAVLGRTVTVGKVKLNPFTLSLTLENFDVREQGGKSSFIGWDRLYVNFNALASITGDWVLSDVALDGFHGEVEMRADGTFNFSDVLTKLTGAPGAADASPQKKSRPLRISSLAVTQARMNFHDRSRPHPFDTTFGPVTFALSDFRTAGGKDAPYRFAATTEAGEKFTWSGTLSVAPVASRGEFAVEDLVLKKYAPYLEGKLRGRINAGTLTVRGRYDLDLDPKKKVMQLADAEVHVRKLLLAEADNTDVLSLPVLDVSGMKADAVALKASVASVALADGRAALRREKDGSLNVLALLANDPSPQQSPITASPATPAPAGKTPDLTVGEIALKNFSVEVKDFAAPRPAQVVLNNIQASIKNATLTDGARFPVSFSCGWAPQGTIRVTGDVAIRPELNAQLTTEVVGLELLPLSPYLEQFADARITKGAVSTTNTVRFAMKDGKPDLNFTGGVKLENFGLVDGARNEELAGFGNVTLTGLKAATLPQLQVSLDEVAVAQPYARVVVAADKTLNLAVVAKTNQKSAEPAPAPVTFTMPAAAPTPTPAASQSLPRIEIARVTIADGDFSFVDNSVEPTPRIGLQHFSGTIAGLSSENLTRGTVELKGQVDGVGPVEIAGKLDPLGAVKFVDLTIASKNVDLVPLSPYVGKFAGYELARGKLEAQVKFLLDGKKVDSTNVVTLNQFTFGTPTNSPDATKLPVRLGVALLKDGDGRIVIDLPVQGTLDDPNFRIGKVVMRVIVNLLTKVATSPFSLLGSMFGGGGDELSFQEFSPGISELQEAQAPKLETLVKALTNRPALTLAMEGGCDVAADTFALKRQKLAERVRTRIWEQRRVIDPSIPPPEKLQITPEDEAAMIKKIFNETFPPGSQFGAPLPAQPKVIAAPAAEQQQRSIVRVIIDALTGRGKDSPEPAKEKPKAPVAEQPATATTAPTGPTPEEMTGRLAESMDVNENDLRALASHRVQQVRDRLIAGGIAADRLFLDQARDAAKENKGPRVFLSLQ